MENNEIKNTVTLTLEEYIDLYEKSKLSSKVTDTIIAILLNACELNRTKDGLKIDSYDLKTSKIMSTIKEYYPEEYERTLKELKEEEN